MIKAPILKDLAGIFLMSSYVFYKLKKVGLGNAIYLIFRKFVPYFQLYLIVQVLFPDNVFFFNY